MRVCPDSVRTTERTGGTRTDASFEKHADDDMAICNTQANDMATMANNWADTWRIVSEALHRA